MHQVVKLSARRWFWGLLFAAFLWGWVGGRWNGSTLSNGMRSTQGVFGEYIFSPLLTPARFVFTKVQAVGVWMVESVSVNRHSGESVADLHHKIDDLNAQLDERDRLLRLSQERFNELQALGPQGLQASDVLAATITGYEAGPGASLISLDKGSSDGVRPGMAVVAQLSLIGRIDKIVGPKTCLVRLVSDPQMKVQAVLARRSKEQSLVLNREPCLIEGLGNGQLQCDTIKVQDLLTEPVRGDLVQLVDRGWPPKVRYMTIGEVQDVRRKETQMLRYDLTIAPRVNINSIQTALIVLRD